MDTRTLVLILVSKTIPFFIFTDPLISLISRSGTAVSLFIILYPCAVTPLLCIFAQHQLCSTIIRFRPALAVMIDDALASTHPFRRLASVDDKPENRNQQKTNACLLCPDACLAPSLSRPSELIHSCMYGLSSSQFHVVHLVQSCNVHLHQVVNLV